MTYAQFIEEIRRLADRGGALIKAEAADGNHDSDLFRDWRHEAESTVNHAQSIGFPLPGKFNSANRTYQQYGDSRATIQRQAFNRDVKASVRELRYLIEQFDKYGAPSPPTRATSKEARLAAPDKVTLRWLIDYVPVRVWILLVGLIAAAFMIGVAAEQYEPTRTLITVVEGLFKSPSLSPH